MQAKAAGNACVGRQEFEDAIQFYRQGIEFAAAEKVPPREQAALYGNRALCRLKLGRFNEALSDSKR